MNALGEMRRLMRLRRRAVGLLLATFLPGTYLVYLLLQHFGLGANPSFLLPVTLWVVAYLYVGARWVWVRCPTCGAEFHSGGTRIAGPSNGACVHCGFNIDYATGHEAETASTPERADMKGPCVRAWLEEPPNSEFSELQRTKAR